MRKTPEQIITEINEILNKNGLGAISIKLDFSYTDNPNIHEFNLRGYGFVYVGTEANK